MKPAYLHLTPLERLGGRNGHPVFPGRHRGPKVLLRLLGVEAARVDRRLVGDPRAREQQRLMRGSKHSHEGI